MSSSILSHLGHALGITAPILVVLTLGSSFRHRGWVNREFVESGNRLLFNVCMPSLLFLATAAQPVSSAVIPLAVFGVAATFVVVTALWFFAPLVVHRENRGEFVQSAFRSNMGMIGIALCVNAYGEGVLARASVFVAAMIVAYNVLAIVVLTSQHSRVLRNLVRNPLLIGILAGIAWQQLRLPLPGIMQDSIAYLARMALPLALLCIGASLQWRTLRPAHSDVLWASALKMLILPAAISAAAVLLGFRGEELGVLFLMVGSPTAMVAFVMAREFAARSDMTAEVIALTTLVMPLTVTAGLTVLASLALI